MTLAVQEWSESLTSRVLAALDQGARERAIALVLEGDGRTRDLASEYRLMHKGLGITLRVTLDALEKHRPVDASAAERILAGFYERYLRTAMRDLTPVLAEPPGRVDASRAGREDVARLLGWVEAEFVRDQTLRTETILEELREGGTATAALGAKRDQGFRPLHDLLIDVLAEIFSMVDEVGGPEALRRFQLVVAEGQRAGIDAWEQSGSYGTAAAFAHLLVQHLGEFEVEEQDDRYLITQRLCGSGGALIRRGRYRGEGALRVVEGPGEVTGGHPELPAYCTHCPMWNTAAPKAWYGHEHVRFIDPAKPDGSCTLAVMKFDER